MFGFWVSIPQRELVFFRLVDLVVGSLQIMTFQFPSGNQFFLDGRKIGEGRQKGHILVSIPQRELVFFRQKILLAPVTLDTFLRFNSLAGISFFQTEMVDLLTRVRFMLFQFPSGNQFFLDSKLPYMKDNLCFSVSIPQRELVFFRRLDAAHRGRWPRTFQFPSGNQFFLDLLCRWRRYQR